MSHRISAASNSPSAVFFIALFLGSRLQAQFQITDLFGYGDQLLDQRAEAMILVDLFAGSLDGRT